MIRVPLRFTVEDVLRVDPVVIFNVPPPSIVSSLQLCAELTVTVSPAAITTLSEGPGIDLVDQVSKSFQEPPPVPLLVTCPYPVRHKKRKDIKKMIDFFMMVSF
jgi:hypothetical protein